MWMATTAKAGASSTFAIGGARCALAAISCCTTPISAFRARMPSSISSRATRSRCGSRPTRRASIFAIPPALRRQLKRQKQGCENQEFCRYPALPFAVATRIVSAADRMAGEPRFTKRVIDNLRPVEAARVSPNSDRRPCLSPRPRIVAPRPPGDRRCADVAPVVSGPRASRDGGGRPCARSRPVRKEDTKRGHAALPVPRRHDERHRNLRLRRDGEERARPNLHQHRHLMSRDGPPVFERPEAGVATRAEESRILVPSPRPVA